MEWTGEFVAARKKLLELAADQYQYSYRAEDAGDRVAAANHRLVAKALAIASKALNGEVLEPEGR